MNKVAYKRFSFFQIMLLPQKFLSSCVVLSSRPLFWQISRKWRSTGRHTLPLPLPLPTPTLHHHQRLFVLLLLTKKDSQSVQREKLCPTAVREKNKRTHTHAHTYAQQTTSLMWAVTSIRSAVVAECRVGEIAAAG